MKQRVAWSLAISVLACTPAYLGAECIFITKKPVRVSGAFAAGFSRGMSQSQSLTRSCC